MDVVLNFPCDGFVLSIVSFTWGFALQCQSLIKGVVVRNWVGISWNEPLRILYRVVVDTID